MSKSIITRFYEIVFLCRTHDFEAQGMYSNPLQFYDFLQNRVMILFRPKFDEPDEEQYPEFDVVLSKKMNYDHVSFIDELL